MNSIISTLYQKLFQTIYTLVTGNSFVPILAITMMTLSCKEAKPQTRKEQKDAEKAIRRENVEQFYLGAIKMCQQTNYQEIFGQQREMSSSLREGTCCTGMVPPPYIDPYEYFIEMLERDKTIMLNNANPFELKKIRNKMADEKEQIKKRAMAIDANNLEYKGTASFVKYDVNTEELKVNSPKQLSFLGEPLLLGVKGADLVNYFGEFSIPLSPKEAEKLFDYYKENYPTGQLIAYSPLNVRITYGLKFPERNTKFSEFEGIVKTMEIYPANNWSYKVATVTF